MRRSRLRSRGRRNPCGRRLRGGGIVPSLHQEDGRRACTWRRPGQRGQGARERRGLAFLGWRRRQRGSKGRSMLSMGTFLCKMSDTPSFDSMVQKTLRLTGSRKSRAALSPALAPWSPSGANRMVAPLEPPVPVSLSYLQFRQFKKFFIVCRFLFQRTFHCNARPIEQEPVHSFHHRNHPSRLAAGRWRCRPFDNHLCSV